ncbi:MAG: triphosphoribosyl-dephospho-CoA synthase [Methylovirgula sp.]
MSSPTEIGEAFLAACREEIEAPKPGNVHIFGAGHGMTAEDFLKSAEAASGSLSASGASVGTRVLTAVEATRAVVGMNTNLGILLLCAPLAAAAERDGTDLEAALAGILRNLDRGDAEQVFRAIRLANPGGLGEVPRYDVHGPATVGLLEAMAEAAERDLIASQYVSNFHDVFAMGSVALEAARHCGLAPPWRAVAVYLHFLAAFPDTHIARKFGPDAAAEVQREASEMLSVFQTRKVDCLADLLAFDERLKLRQRNPGTSADLTVATLFADRLRETLLQRRNDA